MARKKKSNTSEKKDQFGRQQRKEVAQKIADCRARKKKGELVEKRVNKKKLIGQRKRSRKKN